MAYPNAYSMLAILDTLIKIYLPTTIPFAGLHHQQMPHIHFNPHKRSILERAYTNIYQPPMAQTINPIILIPHVHPTKDLTSRRSEKMT
jgi:hypothetical protein